jgi:putative NIF3 family GTP cyclohydrolase 1 type 2
MVVPRAVRAQVLAALRTAHPYDEPAFDLLARVPEPTTAGLGRIGTLPAAMPLRSFVRLVADALPVGAGGVRAAGDPERIVARVAVCGGSGDSLIPVVLRSDADVYVTGDLKHHRTSDAVADAGQAGPAFIDATHVGTEHPWLAQAADLLRADLAASGATVEVGVATPITDPWTLHASDEGSPS